MIELMRIVYSLGIVFVIGYLIQRLPVLEEGRLNFPGNLAIHFGLGSGVVYYAVLVSSAFTESRPIYLVYLILLVLLLLNWRYKRWEIQEISFRLRDISSFLFWFIWVGGFTGYLIYKTGGMDVLSFQENFLHPEYPSLYSSIGMWIFWHIHSTQGLCNYVLPWVYVLMILTLLYTGFRYFLPRNTSLFFMILFVLPPLMIQAASGGTADIPLGFYILAGAIYFHRWHLNPEKFENVIMSAIFFGLCSQVKNEGGVIALIAVVVFLIYFHIPQKSIFKEIPYVIKFVGVLVICYLPWFIMKLLLGISFSPRRVITYKSFIPDWGNILMGMTYFGREFLNFQGWQYIWVLIICSMLIYLVRQKYVHHLEPVWVIFLLQLFAYFCVFTIVLGGSEWFLETTLTRALIGIIPVAYYVSVLSILTPLPPFGEKITKEVTI